MKIITLVISLILILSLQILNVYLYNNNNNNNNLIYNIDNFISEYNDPSKDGKLKYKYLTDPNYSKNILDKYYLNDDSKTLNVRNVYHPYQTKNGREYYGNPKFANKFYESNVYNQYIYSDYIFNQYGIRV